MLKLLRHRLTLQTFIARPLTAIQSIGLDVKDFFIASYPRSGSTWLRFMLYELLTGNPSSFEAVDRAIPGPGGQYHAACLLPNHGRILQTHEPWRKDHRSAIYLVRDVRDVVLSEYNFCLRLRYFAGDFDSFFAKFMTGRINRYGFWGDHIKSWLAAHSGLSEVYILRFEDLRQNPMAALSDLLNFMCIEYSEPDLQQVIANHTIQKMKQKEDQARKLPRNTDGIRFVTDGAVGKGKDALSPAQMAELLLRTGPLLQQLGYAVE